MISYGIAPLSPLVFKWVNYQVFGMEINQYNAIGLLMVVVTILYQIVAYFCLTNLTKEPGYQIFLKLEDREDQNSLASDKSSRKKLISFKEIFTNFDIDQILVEVLVGGVTYSQFEVGINLLALNMFSWSLTYLGIVTLVGIFLAAILMRVTSTFNSKLDVNFLAIVLLLINSILSIIMTFLFTSRI